MPHRFNTLKIVLLSSKILLFSSKKKEKKNCLMRLTMEEQHNPTQRVGFFSSLSFCFPFVLIWNWICFFFLFLHGSLGMRMRERLNIVYKCDDVHQYTTVIILANFNRKRDEKKKNPMIDRRMYTEHIENWRTWIWNLKSEYNWMGWDSYYPAFSHSVFVLFGRHRDEDWRFDAYCLKALSTATCDMIAFYPP